MRAPRAIRPTGTDVAGELMDYHALLDELTAVLAGRSVDQVVVRRSDATGAILDPRGRTEWSNVLLNAIAEVGRRRGHEPLPTRVYFSRSSRGGRNSKQDRPCRADDSGEFMCDMSWWSPPSERSAWWRARGQLRCELVVESEWGALDPSLPVHWAHHEALITQDFCKLLYARSEARLLLTTCVAAHRDELIRCLRHLRRRAALTEGEVCVWLWDYADDWSKLTRPSVELV